LEPASIGQLKQPNGVEIDDYGQLKSESQIVKYSLVDVGAIEGMEDGFRFRLSTESCVTENVAKISVKKRQKSVQKNSSKKELPSLPRKSNIDGTAPPPLPPKMSPALTNYVCEVIYYQKSKRVLKNEIWSEQLEDISAIQSPKVLLAKVELRELMRSAVEPNLVESLLSCVPITETDQVLQAVINIHATTGTALRVIRKFIVEEIRKADVEETLFRTNSNATKLCKFYSRVIGGAYLKHVLTDCIEEIVSGKVEYEIDPNKTDPDKIEQVKLTKQMSFFIFFFFFFRIVKIWKIFASG
jgi:hypothetical protein